ncbi:ribonuclease T2-like [Aplochiton taeniatus]
MSPSSALLPLLELEEELAQFWPTLLKTRTSFQFWKQEWQRHGECAASCVEGLNSPLRYFQTSLKLRASFDIHRALDEAVIRPSCDVSYQLVKIHSALSPFLGESLQIQCVQDNKGREVWVQVKIPLSKNLTLGCHHSEERDLAADFAQKPSPSSGHPCPQESPVYYFPIDHDRPHQPCD